MYPIVVLPAGNSTSSHIPLVRRAFSSSCISLSHLGTCNAYLHYRGFGRIEGPCIVKAHNFSLLMPALPNGHLMHIRVAMIVRKIKDEYL